MTQPSHMAQIVARMNEAFGNPKGDPSRIVALIDAHRAQCINIGAEFAELMKAFGYKADITVLKDEKGEVCLDDIRDALCDIMVFALGAFHRMGIDPDQDMQAVVDAVMTRFCATQEELDATCTAYAVRGVEYSVHGSFPQVFLRSTKDQFMPEYPKGKFLKSVGCVKPVFEPLPAQWTYVPDVVADMATLRAQREQALAAWQDWRRNCIAALEADLDNCDDDKRMQFVNGTLRLSMRVEFVSNRRPL